ncbi:hypothetical protein [Nocardia sp. NPDC058497]|uniref:hypothetical protein n=1 Tax=Nocardia sp. NPDC058497 TaxID=3346529 RepID=UPI00364FDD55
MSYPVDPVNPAIEAGYAQRIAELIQIASIDLARLRQAGPGDDEYARQITCRDLKAGVEVLRDVADEIGTPQTWIRRALRVTGVPAAWGPAALLPPERPVDRAGRVEGVWGRAESLPILAMTTVETTPISHRERLTEQVFLARQRVVLTAVALDISPEEARNGMRASLGQMPDAYRWEEVLAAGPGSRARVRRFMRTEPSVRRSRAAVWALQQVGVDITAAAQHHLLPTTEQFLAEATRYSPVTVPDLARPDLVGVRISAAVEAAGVGHATEAGDTHDDPAAEAPVPSVGPELQPGP